jgi:predicted HTH transcriptional regulator
VTLSDLELASLKKFRELATVSGRLSSTDLSSSDAGLLEKLKLTEGTYLKRSAVLLFHEDPDRFITGAFVKIGFFVSESEIAYHDKSPIPAIRLAGHDLWVEFPYSDDYLALLEGETVTKEQVNDSGTGLVDRLVDRLVENQQKILRMVKSDPHISKKTMAKTIGISTTAIDKNIEKLKDLGFLKRVGSPRSGYWEVLK